MLVGGGAVADETAEGARYWAFISYSHKDAAFGRRLHRRLESYVVPRRLAGQTGRTSGAIPKRLVPIFRDREELPAAHDLSTEVRAALAASRSLIVVCSAAAASSPWVAREIETFRALHPDRPILAAIRDGEPGEVFPAALYASGPDGRPIEPLAADFRSGRDGDHLGLLKLVAGVIGIGLDELIRRDAHRRNQRVTAVTAGALAAMVVMGVLTGFALTARQDAERQRMEAEYQRRKAEDLIDFMLKDLRTKLKGVGRLDIMAAVNEKALAYYAGQRLETLSVSSLERRATILMAMGEDDETRGRRDDALRKFGEARRTTAALLAAAPNDPNRIFNHAQNEFWLGYVDFQQDRFAPAKRYFLEYKRLADRLVVIAPSNTDYQAEVGYADSNLCSVAIKGPPDPAAALKYCTEALQLTEAAAKRAKPSDEVTDNLIERHAWLADAYFANGDFVRARTERDIQEQMLSSRLAADPKNMDLQDSWVAMQRAFAKLDRKDGREASARERLQRALQTTEKMIEFDPTNNEWKKTRTRILEDMSVPSP